MSRQTAQTSKQPDETTRRTETIVQSIKDMLSPIVGAPGRSQPPVGGQPWSRQPHRSDVDLAPNSRANLKTEG